MRLLSCTAAVAALVLSGPTLALAQTATAPAPAAQPAAPAPAEAAESPEAAAFEAKGEAFETSMEAMATEMQAAAAQADKAKAKTDLDALQARYQSQADTFAEELQTYAVAQGAPADQMAMAATQIKSIPAMVRAKAEEAAAAPAQPQ